MRGGSYLQLKGSKQPDRIFELYLFINPIGFNCYRCEEELLKFIANTTYKVHFNFITFHNFQTVTQYMKRIGLNDRDLQLRNETYSSIYDASLAYKAALLQGKKMGRNFLITLQRYINVDQIPYSQSLLDTVVDEIGLDKDMFYEDKASQIVRMDYEKDQQIAQEMNITKNPSLVIFDSLNQSFGIKIDSLITEDTIRSVCFDYENMKTQSSRPWNYNNTYPMEFLHML